VQLLSLLTHVLLVQQATFVLQELLFKNHALQEHIVLVEKAIILKTHVEMAII
jgi:hypothetical protein